MAETIRETINRVNAIGNEHAEQEGPLPEGALYLCRQLGLPYDALWAAMEEDDVVTTHRGLPADELVVLSGDRFAAIVKSMLVVGFIYGASWERARGE